MENNQTQKPPREDIAPLIGECIQRLSKQDNPISRLRPPALRKLIEKSRSEKQAEQIQKIPLADVISNLDITNLENEIEVIEVPREHLVTGEAMELSGILEISTGRISYWLTEEMKNAGFELRFYPGLKEEDIHISNLTETIEDFSIKQNDIFLDYAIGFLSKIIKITIPRRYRFEKPVLIRILHDHCSGSISAFLMIHLQESSHGRFLLEINAAENTCDQKIIPFILAASLEKDSSLDILETQCVSDSDYIIPFEKIEIGENANLNHFIFDKGGALNRRFLSIEMNQLSGQARVSGVYLGNGNRQFIYDTHQNHHASMTQSNLLFKGVLEDKASALWKGNVYVAQGTHGVDGYQMNNNLLLSGDAQAESIPGLEILADDVRCSHGVTLSSIDANQLFYLQTRGIQPSLAVDLIKKGFVVSVVSRIEDEEIREIALRKMEVDID